MRQGVDKTVVRNKLQLEIVRGTITSLCFGGRDDPVSIFLLHLLFSVSQRCCFSIKSDNKSRSYIKLSPTKIPVTRLNAPPRMLFTLRFEAASH